MVGVLAHHRRRQRAVGHAGHPPPGPGLHPLLVGFGDADGDALAGSAGFLFDGVYRATAWVVSVMLPPMAIFFPLFTLLEDLRVPAPGRLQHGLSLPAKAGAHGKQALTMSHGLRLQRRGSRWPRRVIDSPRERLIAIITNNFSALQRTLAHPDPDLAQHLHRGRWPRPHSGGLASAGGSRGDRGPDRGHSDHVAVSLVAPVPKTVLRGRGHDLQPGAASVPPAPAPLRPSTPPSSIARSDRPLAGRSSSRYPPGR